MFVCATSVQTSQAESFQAWVLILYYIAGFDGFTIIPIQDELQGTSYLVILSFTHDVVIEGFANIDNSENCTATPINSKTMTISCIDLLYGTSYSLIIEGMTSLDDGSPLKFTVPLGFTTGELPVMSETG